MRKRRGGDWKPTNSKRKRPRGSDSNRARSGLNKFKRKEATKDTKERKYVAILPSNGWHLADELCTKSSLNYSNTTTYSHLEIKND